MKMSQIKYVNNESIFNINHIIATEFEIQYEVWNIRYQTKYPTIL